MKAQWFCKGKPITPNKKYEIIVDGCVHKLIIKGVKPEDVADYSMTVKDKTTKAALSVEGKIDIIIKFNKSIFHVKYT